MTTPRFFKVERSQHAYLTFIVESYEGICTVSTVDNKNGIIRVSAIRRSGTGSGGIDSCIAGRNWYGGNH
jgi:hypothetical protein